MSNHIVFGVEKPRLVINEVYGEVVNDPNDPAFSNPMKTAGSDATHQAEIRFWLELHNPTKIPYGQIAGPLGMTVSPAGSVKVRYLAAIDGVTFSPYQVQIVRNTKGGDVSSLLRNPANPNNAANVLGSIGTTPDLTFDFSAADAVPNKSPAQISRMYYTVKPSVDQFGNPFSSGAVMQPLHSRLRSKCHPADAGPEFNPTFTSPQVIPATPTPAAIGASSFRTLVPAAACGGVP